MKINELIKLLSEYPNDMPIKLHVGDGSIIDLTDENILHTSETAHVDDDAPEEEWDHEDGKIELGSGQQYLLINPIIY